MAQEGRNMLPEPCLVAAGAVGGPLVIFSLTPLRNAMSNAAQDQRSGFISLYRKLLGPQTLGFRQRVSLAYTGAAVSAPAACPQWCMIGPTFHILDAWLPTPVALLGTATLETFITFGSQTRNAQMAHNVQTKDAVPLSNVARSWGPGAPFYVMRNFCGMAGIRWISPYIQASLPKSVPSGPREVLSDMGASMLTCVLSAPLNSCWSFIVTTPSMWGFSTPKLMQALIPFLQSQYWDQANRRLSRLAFRDLSVRCVYIASCFTMYSAIERLAITHWSRGSSSK
ncbi:MAG: hypothetical protein SGPRY_014271 [Prymnesium sp.]